MRSVQFTFGMLQIYNIRVKSSSSLLLRDRERGKWCPGFRGLGVVPIFIPVQDCEDDVVLDFFKRKKLSGEGEKRLVVALARAEESIIEAHVENALDVIEALGDALPLDRVLELYLDALVDNPRRAEIIARRVLTRLNYDEAE